MRQLNPGRPQPHAAIREDISANAAACEKLTALHSPDLILLESGGDNLAANFTRELADYIICKCGMGWDGMEWNVM